jgi:hypothetical protein
MALGALAALAMGGFYLEVFEGHTLGSRKLADCTADTLTIDLEYPRGRSFQLLLGVREPPGGASSPPPFRGEVVIDRGGQEVRRFPIHTSLAQPSNWLDHHGLNGAYILTGNPRARIADILKPNERYRVRVRFARRPPAGPSLWLHWIGGS